MENFDHLRTARTVLLTTRRKNGETVDTPVSFAVDADGLGYFRTWDGAGKVKRLHNFPGVRVAPCSANGRAQGSDQPAVASQLTGPDAAKAQQLLAEKYPVVHGVLVPRFTRLRRLTPVYFRLAPAAEPTPWQGLNTVQE